MQLLKRSFVCIIFNIIINIFMRIVFTFLVLLHDESHFGSNYLFDQFFFHFAQIPVALLVVLVGSPYWGNRLRSYLMWERRVWWYNTLWTITCPYVYVVDGSFRFIPSKLVAFILSRGIQKKRRSQCVQRWELDNIIIFHHLYRCNWNDGKHRQPCGTMLLCSHLYSMF